MHECSKAEDINRISESLVEGRLQFNKIDNKLDSMARELSQVLAQATRTNGRVTKLERFQRVVITASVAFILGLVASKLGLLELLKLVK